MQAREIPHKGGRTLGFRISDGTSTIAYLSDHGPSSLGPGPDGYGPYHESAVLLAAEADPGGVGELQAAVVAVAGVDRPVATGLALGQLVPGACGVCWCGCGNDCGAGNCYGGQ